jgi:hypothetical protein
MHPLQGSGEPRQAPGDPAARLAQLRRRIIESDWADPELLLEAGDLCARLGRRDEAVGMLARALELDRNHARARAALQALADPDELARLEVPLPAMPLWEDPLEPFLYPLRGDVAYMLIIGSVIFVPVAAVVLWSARYGVFGDVLRVPVFLLAAGYLLALLGRVVKRSATGSSRAPDWPAWDFSMFFGGFLALFLFLVPMGPALAWDMWAPGALGWNRNAHLAGLVGLVAAGALLLPMILLLCFIGSSFLAALSPFRLVANICRAGRDYWCAALVWAVLCAGITLLAMLLGRRWPLCAPLTAVPLLYGLLAGGRAAGRVYESAAERLGWHAAGRPRPATALSSTVRRGTWAISAPPKKRSGLGVLAVAGLGLLAAALAGGAYAVFAGGGGSLALRPEEETRPDGTPVRRSFATPEEAVATFWQAVVDDSPAQLRAVICREAWNMCRDYREAAELVGPDRLRRRGNRTVSAEYEVYDRLVIGEKCVCRVWAYRTFSNGRSAVSRTHTLLVREDGSWKLHATLFKYRQRVSRDEFERLADAYQAAGFHVPARRPMPRR